MTADSPTPQLSSELAALDQVLGECPGDAGGMTLSELDGYLAGVLVSPYRIPQDRWLQELWGGSPQAFPDDAERSGRLDRMILDRKSRVAADLLRGDLAYDPIFDVHQASGEVVCFFWAQGFSRAVRLTGEAWNGLVESSNEDLGAAALGLLMYVAQAQGIDVGAGELDQPPVNEMIPYLVETLYRCQNGLPRIVMDASWDIAPQPVTRSKIGRNEPCPCGSGKKFKKCCGTG